MSFAAANKARIGKELPLETRRKISESLKGKTPWNKGKKGLYEQSAESKEKIRKAMKGRVLSEEWKQKISKAHTGKPKNTAGRIGLKFSEERKRNMSKSRIGKGTGEANGNWKGGATSINMIIRASKLLQNWRIKVFERDDYTCQICEQWGGKLEAHHIKSFAEYPEKRFWVSNGLTLCKRCHHTITVYERIGKLRGKYKINKLKLREVV